MTTPSYSQVASEFSTFYYQSFDQDRKSVLSLFRPFSTMAFQENQPGSYTEGAEKIAEKLVALPFQKTEHVVHKTDSLPLPNGVAFVQIAGEVKIDGESSHRFTQSFLILQDAAGYYIMSTIFSLG